MEYDTRNNSIISNLKQMSISGSGLTSGHRAGPRVFTCPGFEFPKRRIVSLRSKAVAAESSLAIIGRPCVNPNRPLRPPI